MLYLKLDSTIVDEHYSKLKGYLEGNVNTSSISDPLKVFILENLKEILTGKPKSIFLINSKFKKHSDYKSTKTFKNKITKIFHYKYFTNKKKPDYNAYDLAALINVRTCLYCNRNYALTIRDGRAADNQITRPEFDHFFDKGDNPLLGLSIYNLIPSCKTCNSTLKGKKKFSLGKNIHPYIDDIEQFYTYTFNPYDVLSILGGASDLSVQIVESGSASLQKKISNSSAIFKLEKIMSGHAEELKDLLLLRQHFTVRYFIELLSTHAGIHLSLEEVYRIVFGVYYDAADYSKRPFSKLKKDILEELGVILELKE